MIRNEEISAIILAAGYSSRMGDFKPLLKYGPRTVLERSVRLFRQAGVDDVVVVVGYRRDDLIPLLRQWNARWAINERFDDGMFSSIRTGIDALEPSKKAFFLLPVDVPLVRLTTIRDLIDVFARSRPHVSYPCFLGKRGHPPLISTELREGILNWHGNGGLRSFLNTEPLRSVEVEVADEHVVLNANTLEHYRALCSRVPDYDIPSPAECMILLVEKCFVSKKVLTHCCKVAEVASSLAAALKGLGWDLNEPLVVAAALLHDMAKGRPDHATTAEARLRKLGYPRVAELVGAHMSTAVRDDHTVDELDVVRLADRVVEEDRVVLLEHKFENKMLRHKANPQVTAAIRERYYQCRMLKQKVENVLGEPVESVVSECAVLSRAVKSDDLLAQTW
jgi:molybdenum cofactor cytidylyltransferase